MKRNSDKTKPNNAPKKQILKLIFKRKAEYSIKLDQKLGIKKSTVNNNLIIKIDKAIIKKV